MLATKALAYSAQTALPEARVPRIVEKTASPRNPTTNDHGCELLELGDQRAASKRGPTCSGVNSALLE
jgi:hypothetical protein